MDFQRQTRHTRELPLVPLIDIFFLMMFFFMLTTSFIASESIELALPSAGGPTVSAAEVQRIYCTPEGFTQMNGEQLNLAQLDTKLGEMMADNPDKKILVLSTEGVNVQQLVSVLDLIYLNGGTQVQVDRYASAPTPDTGTINGLPPA